MRKAFAVSRGVRVSVDPGPSGQQELGRVQLYLVDSAKSVEEAPGRIALGLVRLRAWQLDRIEPIPSDLADHAAYLVRVSYEFEIAPDVRPAAWAEVEFKFPNPEVMVHDALPMRVVKQAAAASYELTAQLRFTGRGSGAVSAWPEGSPAANIPLPVLDSDIQSFGIGGNLIRWRHAGKVSPGAHVGWLILRVPESWAEVPVVAGAKYPVKTLPNLRLRATCLQDAFTVQLPAVDQGKPGGSALRPTAGLRGGRRVFVSYAQESPAHKAAVAELCEFLLGKGLDIRFDQQNPHERRIWDDWTNTQILRADYVLVIASPAYRNAGNSEPRDDNERRGVVSEYLRLVDLQHRRRSEWTRKILPVVLPGRSPEEIPLSFLPGIADYYDVSSITDEGAADLLNVLLHSAVSA